MAGGKQKSELECPRCGGQRTSVVRDTKIATDKRSRTRTYFCEECTSTYRTREKVESQGLDTGVVVRKGRAGDTDIRWAPYSRAEISERLRDTLVKVLGQSQRDAVLATFEQLLGQRLGELSQRVPLTVARQRKWQLSRVYVTTAQVRELVEEVLKASGQHLDDRADRERHEVAHALWALSTSGGQWRTLDAINWLHENYRLGRAPRPSVQPSTNSVAWHPPSFEFPTRPVTVVKNFRHPRLDPPSADTEPAREPGTAYLSRPIEDFDQAKLRKKIRVVFAGRPRADQITDGITHWVMWSLVGQRVVRSSQISALVVDGLRRTDEIAYLRWVTVGKELSVAQLHQEALDILQYPGTRLVFRADAAPSVRPVLLAGSGHHPTEE